jgi:hypothetical protein
MSFYLGTALVILVMFITLRRVALEYQGAMLYNIILLVSCATHKTMSLSSSCRRADASIRIV